MSTQTDIEDGILVEDEPTTLAGRAEDQRLLLYLEEAHQALPIFGQGPLPAELTLERALEMVREGVRTSVLSDASAAMSVEAILHDAQEGRQVPVKIGVSYETRGSYLTRRALAALVVVLSQTPTTPMHAARTIGQVLWATLNPGKISVSVKPMGKSQVSEEGKFSRKIDDESATYTLTEELIRLTLSLKVPVLMAALVLRGGPTDVESEGAADAARELVVRIKNAPNEQELELLCKLVAVAAFDEHGVGFMGLHFNAGDA